MARQMGIKKLRGTIGELCFYEMEGTAYVRLKSKLSRERVKKDEAFAETRRHSELLARAAQQASQVYQTFPKNERSRKKFQQLVGMDYTRVENWRILAVKSY